MHTAFSGSINKALFKEQSFPSVHPGQLAAVNKALMSKSTDEVSIGLLTPEKTQALLNRQIADKLEQRFKEEGVELKGLQAEDFTPEKVSERILGFVSGRILAEQDNDRQLELMEQARQGIEQGFAEARDILDSLDVLNGRVKEEVDSTYDLIQQGLARLADQINGIAVDPEDEDEQEADKGIRQVQQAAIQNSFSRAENTRIEITTRDGDTVLIDLFKQQSARSSKTFSQNEQGVSYTESRTLSASTGISYQVQGDLDEDEQQAIDDLLKEVAKVSDSFFSGNVQKAFNSAMNMDFDNEELMRFSLNMDYKESRQVAISTYSNYQSHSQAVGENSEHPAAGLKDMSDFIKQMDHLFQNPFALQKFDHPEQGIGDLLKGMNQLLHSQDMKKLEQDSSDLLDSLVDQLKKFHGHDMTAGKNEETELPA